MAGSFDGHRAIRLGELERVFQARLLQGFATAPFDGEPEPETLQCRDSTDQIRWLGLAFKCREAIAQGFGALPIDPPIRCTSNREYAVSHDDALSRMLTLLSGYAAALKHYWGLKDAIRAAESRAGLYEIDLEEGWP